MTSPLDSGDPTIDMDVYVRGGDGAPIEVTAMVTLVSHTGQVASQGTTLGGTIQFHGLVATEYTIQVVAPGYENAVKEFDGYNAGAARVYVEMRPSSNGDTGAGSLQVLLAPKAQKELNKAIEALRAKKLEEARSHLEAAHRIAPNHPAVNYLFGVYFLQTKEVEKAKSYWAKALEFDPKHGPALLAWSEMLVREQKLADAEAYGRRAVEADPNSWRAHAVLADIFLKEQLPEGAAREAQRALEVGKGEAARVQPLLALALASSGNKDRATKILQDYLHDHPEDAAARTQLENLQSPGVMRPVSGETTQGEAGISAASGAAPHEPRAASSLEPSADESILAVDPAAAVNDPARSILSPKGQEAYAKAFELLGSDLTTVGARQAPILLSEIYRMAPANPDVNYLLGVYAVQSNDRLGAKSYWAKSIELNAQHYRALISLSQVLLDENKPDEALPYLERAIHGEPFSWRAYALLAQAHLFQGSPNEAAKQAARALELGGKEAAIAQRYLAAALAELGQTDKAVSVLQSYLQNHSIDNFAKEQLRKLRTSTGSSAKVVKVSPADVEEPSGLAVISSHALPMKWLPPNVDERVPPVEPNVACKLDDVLTKTAQRVKEFISDVDRFTATESLFHETIGMMGLVTFVDKRRFDYVVSINEVNRGFIDVNEYRKLNSKEDEFPEGIATRGLPAMILIFHPNSIGNFQMTCEGLAKWNGRLAWQVRLEQRADKPRTIKSYKSGEYGQSYDVALKGRAWIAADSYQLLRLETDLMAPVPEIRLVADHTEIEYGPVHFQNKNVSMWLPQNAETYFDWRGRKIHRRHSFSNYLLFSVDEKQRISDPKTETKSSIEH